MSTEPTARKVAPVWQYLSIIVISAVVGVGFGIHWDPARAGSATKIQIVRDVSDTTTSTTAAPNPKAH